MNSISALSKYHGSYTIVLCNNDITLLTCICYSDIHCISSRTNDMNLTDFRAQDMIRVAVKMKQYMIFSGNTFNLWHNGTRVSINKNLERNLSHLLNRISYININLTHLHRCQSIFMALRRHAGTTTGIYTDFLFGIKCL